MRWISLLLPPLLVVLPAEVRADDFVCLYGSYYKERSTRVISPMVQIGKDLPWDSQAKVTYLVDQITSASIAFNPVTDEVFQEHRHEFRVEAGTRFFDRLTQSLSFRYSDEPDYKSVGAGANLRVDLLQRNIALDLGFDYLHDSIKRRPIGGRTSTFRENADTYRIALGATQLLSKAMIAGVSLEAQLVRGYQQNQYRANENHPQVRNRYVAGVFGAYRFESTGTTVRVDVRGYIDSWDLKALTGELRVTQGIVPSFEVEPYVRGHLQSAVEFAEGMMVGDEFYQTSDPKLTAFNAQTFGLRLSWRLAFLNGTFLDLFEDALIQPYYAFVRQTNRYGNAHEAQLGMFWPF